MMHKSGRNDTITPGASVDKTLGDYIARKSDPPKKKLTFENWLYTYVRSKHEDLEMTLRECWKAAQENK